MLAGAVFAATVAARFLNGEEIMQGYDPYSSDPSAMMAAMGPFFAVAALIGLVFFVFYIFCWGKIFAKAGYSGALSLINLAVLIPFIGWIAPLVLFIWFAFSRWPALNANTNPTTQYPPV